MLCPKCHNRIVKGSSFCHICGEPIPQQKVEKTILSRVKQKEEIKKEKSKKRKYVAIIFFLIIIIAVMVGIYLFLNMNEPSYSSDNIVSQQVEKALYIDKDKVTLEIGESTTIKANLKCTYTVQDASICKINQEGTITALAAGKTKIFCISESGKKETVKVTVNKKEETIDEQTKMKNIVIICSSGMGTSSILKKRLMKKILFFLIVIQNYLQKKIYKEKINNNYEWVLMKFMQDIIVLSKQKK